MRPAAAQIVHRSAARQEADQRRALREARRLDVPYKESHLRPGRRLGRDQGAKPHAEGSDRFRFENGNHPRVVEPVFPALHRKQKVRL